MSTEQSEVNIREVAPDVWTFSAPFTRSGLVPMGNRTTAIKLKNGSVWVLPSTPLDGPTKAKLNELGPVAYLLSGDSDHHMYLPDFHKEYASAKLIVNSYTADQDSKKGLPFFGVFGKDTPDTTYGFEPEIEHVYFSGHRKGDVAFFHAASRSLLVQDLLFNQPAKEEHNESYANSDQSGHVPFQEKLFQPFSGLHQTMVNLLGKEQATMERDVRKVSSWDFDRVITCHGNIIETGGKDAWNTAFAKFLQK